uniref:Transcription factor bHLH123 n=1 Tax=Anthurium amnicola TaxID=1678845 RepID=A0A1D1XYK4_9ARAE
MGEEFHTSVCSGSWWNAEATRGGFDVLPPPSTSAAASCSVAVGDMGTFRWTTEMLESKASPGEGSSPSASASGGSTVTFHGTPMIRASGPTASDGFQLEPTLVPVVGSGLPCSSMDWNQVNFLRSNRRVEGGFHANIPHDHLCSRAYLSQEDSMESDKAHTGVGHSGFLFRDFNQGFMADQRPRLSSGDVADDGFRGISFASTTLHGLIDQEMKPQTSSIDTCSTNLMSPRFPRFLKASPPKQQPPHGHLQFSNNTPFWNATGNSVRTAFGSSAQTHELLTQEYFEGKPHHSNTKGKYCNSEGTRDATSAATAAKKSVNEPTLKKARIEAPSPLPTFKVRKEKLGDRITALQQLVSPFGKTDTASVLHEAIEYIKFLHDQVGVLSSPYMKNGSAMQYQQISDESKDSDGPKPDLKTRGLCLVPISFTLPVVNEPTTDFWTPTFGGTYR